MIIKWLELHNFRNYTELLFEPKSAGAVIIVGNNGQGKTSLLEAISYLSTKKSFRGAVKESMISYDSVEAVIRAGFESSHQRDILVEASMMRSGRDRFLVNKQPLSKVSDINKVIPVTVFAAQDIEVVRGAPQLRRDFLDQCVAMLFPRGSSILSSVEKVLRQRNVLLKQSGGALTAEIASTLEVWDQQLSVYGTKLVELRSELVELMTPYVFEAYRVVSGSNETVSLAYKRSWDGDLYNELVNHRRDDLRRQTNGIGPHRDELEIDLDGHPIRHNGSQGEQRTAAYALKIAFHSLYRDRVGEDPILLLDDVFSELDEVRSEAILRSVSAAQTILTTTGNIPGILEPTMKIYVKEGRLVDSLG